MGFCSRMLGMIIWGWSCVWMYGGILDGGLNLGVLFFNAWDYACRDFGKGS